MPWREYCLLRPMAEKDIKKVLEWRNSERVRANMFSDHLITMDEHLAWFERARNQQPSLFMLFEYGGNPQGVISVSDVDNRNSKCQWGFYIGEANAPRGIGTIMGYLGLEYIFEKMNMRKLIGEVIAFNQGSINYHDKLGFVKEGHFVKHVLKNGNYEDVSSFALFKDDWMKSKSRLEKLCFSNRYHK